MVPDSGAEVPVVEAPAGLAPLAGAMVCPTVDIGRCAGGALEWTSVRVAALDAVLYNSPRRCM